MYDIPTPKDKAAQIETAFKTEVDKLLETCVKAINNADSLTVTVHLRSKGASQAAIEKVIEILTAKQWNVEIEKGGKGGPKLVITG